MCYIYSRYRAYLVIFRARLLGFAHPSAAAWAPGPGSKPNLNMVRACEPEASGSCSCSRNSSMVIFSSAGMACYTMWHTYAHHIGSTGVIRMLSHLGRCSRPV